MVKRRIPKTAIKRLSQSDSAASWRNTKVIFKLKWLTDDVESYTQPLFELNSCGFMNKKGKNIAYKAYELTVCSHVGKTHD